MHPREQVIRSMARTLIVESFASWCDEPGNAAQAEPYRAAGGQDWMDTTPAMSPSCREAALIEAAVLYGRIKQSWGTEPWILVQGHTDKHGVSHAQDFKGWGHYAVMTCIGHGVAWEDDREHLAASGKSYTLLSQHNFAVPRIESLEMDWASELEDWG